MSKQKYNQIIDRAYEDYSRAYEKDNSVGLTLLVRRTDGKSTYRKPDKEMFESMVLHDESFAKKWGFSVSKREMTWEETVQWVMRYTDVELENLYIVEEAHKPTTPRNIIQIEYQNESAEIYE
jgi:hypothetical protein